MGTGVAYLPLNQDTVTLGEPALELAAAEAGFQPPMAMRRSTMLFESATMMSPPPPAPVKAMPAGQLNLATSPAPSA